MLFFNINGAFAIPFGFFVVVKVNELIFPDTDFIASKPAIAPEGR